MPMLAGRDLTGLRVRTMAGVEPLQAAWDINYVGRKYESGALTSAYRLLLQFMTRLS